MMLKKLTATMCSVGLLALGAGCQTDGWGHEDRDTTYRETRYDTQDAYRAPAPGSAWGTDATQRDGSGMVQPGTRTEPGVAPRAEPRTGTGMDRPAGTGAGTGTYQPTGTGTGTGTGMDTQQPAGGGTPR